MALTQASIQCATRPADESFDTIESWHDANVLKRTQSRNAVVNLAELEIVPVEKDIELIIPTVNGKLQTKFTNWSYNQLSNAINITPTVTKLLPPDLASQVMNYGLKNLASGSVAKENLHVWEQDDSGRAVNTNARLLYRTNGHLTLDAVTTPNYGRFWDADASQILLDYANEYGLHPAPKAFNGYRGLYSGPRDTFGFVVDNERRIFEKDPNGGLSRGIMISNSEVGASVLWIMTFLYEYVCGNHMVWGAQEVKEYRLRHSKKMNERLDLAELNDSLGKYLLSSPIAEEQKIQKAKDFELGKTKDELLEAIQALRNPMIGKRFAERIYDRAVEQEKIYGNPRSVWGYSNALTEFARDQIYANQRVALEQAASTVLDLAA